MKNTTIRTAISHKHKGIKKWCNIEHATFELVGLNSHWAETCRATDGNESYYTKQCEEPKSPVMDYLDRLIIQRKQGAVGKMYTNNTVRYTPSRRTEPQSAVRWRLGLTARLLCKRWQRLGTVLHVQSRCWQLFTGVIAKWQKSSEHLWTFGRHSRGWYVGLAEAVGTLAGFWKWIQPTRLNWGRK